MTQLQTPVFAGNWKMHHRPDEARAFFREFLRELPEEEARGTIAFFPPAISFVAARDAAAARPSIRLGVQNVHWEEEGAFTGETSVGMAAAVGASLVLVGHSERRQLFGENNADTARKVAAVLGAGLTPVLCVGETLEQREQGRAGEVVQEQLEAVLQGLTAAQLGNLVLAYEPVWAIGTGRTAAPADAAEMHGRIREILTARSGDAAAEGVPILYGGSVKPQNATDLLRAGDVDGLLVGGASLDPADFARICRAAS